MRLENNTILITGGSVGIGFAFAKYFSKNNNVIICGRDLSRLEAAKKSVPSLNIYKCDISKKDECDELFNIISKEHPQVNVLINNAGIQKEIRILEGNVDIDEVDINFKGTIYLSILFAKFIRNKPNAAIINISSGLAFVPSAIFPIYCATKAGIHSFTMSLRRQLQDKNVEVIEVIPPMVHDTFLKGKPIERNERSISTTELLEEVINGLKENKVEIPVGATKYMIENSKKDINSAFEQMNKNFVF